jgi:probable HAF family extracellular repeat protein
MSEEGHITGWFETEQPIPEVHAFVWKGGSFTDLGHLGGLWSEGRDVNRLGQVVGVSKTSTGESRAFFAYEGVMYDLTKMVPTVPRTAIGDPVACYAPLRVLVEANAINDEGWIAACGFFDFDNRAHGLLLQPAGLGPADPRWTVHDLGFLEGDAVETTDCLPLDVNDNDQAVGVSARRAFIWTDQTIRALEPYTVASRANALNNPGAAVGWIDTDHGHNASCWYGDLRFDLGVESGWISEALAVNDSEIMVGWAAEGIGGPHEAILWEGLIPVRLNKVSVVPVRAVMLPWDQLTEATAIDSRGRIAGFATSSADGKTHAFLLTPIQPGDA